jgi:lysophospholipase L1-like esterase
MLFLGDSLTTGAREPFGMAWPFYLAHAALADGVAVLPEVAAENGRRSSDLVRIAQPIIEGSTAKEAFVLIGTNDAKDDGTLPVELTVRNVELIHAWCKVASKRCYVLTVPLPLGFGSVGYTQAVVDRIRTLNEALRARGFAQLVECEDVRDTMDGIHLSDGSARAIADRVWRHVKAARSFA